MRIAVPLLKEPFPAVKEFDARLRKMGFRPATRTHASMAREAQLRAGLDVW